MSVERRGTRLPAAPATFTVKAGVLAGATYPEAEITDARTGKKMPDPRGGMAVAIIARALNYGSRDIPPRPFMTNTAAERRKEWADAVVKLVSGGMAIEDALQVVGQIMKEDIQKSINDWPADNSPHWAGFKGFNKGLIFTSHLLNSIAFAVEKAS